MKHLLISLLGMSFSSSARPSMSRRRSSDDREETPALSKAKEPREKKPWYLAKSAADCRPPLPCEAGQPSFSTMLEYRTRWSAAAKRLLPMLPPFSALSLAAERSDGLRETDARQIDTDLARSHVDGLQLAESDLPLHRASLRHVLRAWCVLRPDWGYSQAMNFVAAVMLAVAGHDEPTALLLFAGLIARLPPDFYAESPPLRGFQVEVAAIFALLEDRGAELLDLSDGVVREVLPLVACKWFLNMFVDTLPLASLLAVWDIMLTLPEPAVAAAPAEEAAEPASSEAVAKGVAEGAAPPEALSSAAAAEAVAAAEAAPSAAAAEAVAAAEAAPLAAPLAGLAQLSLEPPSAAAAFEPSDVLLRVSLALLSEHEEALLTLLREHEADGLDASTAYAAMLAIGADSSPAAITSAAAAMPLPPGLAEGLRAVCRATLEAADDVEVITPVRARAQHMLLRLDELQRLKKAIALAALHPGALPGAHRPSHGNSTARTDHSSGEHATGAVSGAAASLPGTADGAVSGAPPGVGLKSSHQTVEGGRDSVHGGGSSSISGSGSCSSNGSGSCSSSGSVSVSVCGSGSGSGSGMVLPSVGSEHLFRQKSSGGSGLDRALFASVLHREAPQLKEVGMRLYEVLAMHGDEPLPKVPWRELAAALATALRGSLTERLHFVFECFDPEGTGHIDVPNLMAMASMLFKLRLLDPTAADRPLTSSMYRRRRAGRRRPPSLGQPTAPSRARGASILPEPPAATPSTTSTAAAAGAANEHAASGADGTEAGTAWRQTERHIGEAASEGNADVGGDVFGGAVFEPRMMASQPTLTLHSESDGRGTFDSDGRGTCERGTYDDGRDTYDRSYVTDTYDPRLSVASVTEGVSSARRGWSLTPSDSQSCGDSPMCRSTAPVRTVQMSPAQRTLTSPRDWSTEASLLATMTPGSVGIGSGSGRGGRHPHLGGRGAGDSREVPSVPRLRRVATVCGGDRFEFVQKQVNEFLQLLLIMDVCRSGRLSYAEWVRGVLSLPEVLVCFQLAIPLPNGSALPGSSSECRGRGANHVASSPFTTHPPAASADGSAHHSAGLVLVGFGSQRAPVDNPYLVANGSALAAAATVAASASERASRITESLTSVHTSLWLRSMRALLANLGCGAS